jgi:mannitol-1-/sugar-/sorbitol-6-phosphatase
MTSVFDNPFLGFLFDMDGTIVNSKASADRVWSRWAEEHGLDVADFLPKMHGSRSVDTIRRLNLPGIDPEREAALIEAAEGKDVGDVVEIPGARDFLMDLPPERWALVTSSSRELVLRRLEAAGLPRPRFLVTADEVKTGKPSPEGYLLGAKKLGVRAEDCLVFEDTSPGISAGEASGAKVLVINAVHQPPIATHHESVDNFRTVGTTAEGRNLVLRKRAEHDAP